MDGKRVSKWSRWAVLGAAMVFLCFGTVPAGAEICDDCYEGSYELAGQTWNDAMCCMTDGDCGYVPDDYHVVISHTSWCSVSWVNEFGYACNGSDNTCGGGGGGTGGGGTGGGGGSCIVGFGQECPAECFSCERDPFLN
jgi:hypothetical protein